jgi:asparagine synthetase A
MINNSTYLKKILEFIEEDIIKELESICIEQYINPKEHLIHLYTGGIEYTLKSIVTEIYLSRRPINEDVRQKLLLLHILLKTDISSLSIFRMNEELKQLKQHTWDYEKVQKQKIEMIKKINSKIRQIYQNCFTCADQETGCRGEDKECKSPDYADWRSPKILRS